ncbi:MAG: UvrD-helicase domain-containing protein, partial [Clostridiales bacterium]
MSSFDFSPEQQQAIASRGENLLVAAGAGSGKTSVLVERIIRRLSDREHPGSLQRLLVLTFTNAAAADMRAKIHGALTAMVKAEPDNRHILQELHQLPQASI